MEDVEFVIKAA